MSLLSKIVTIVGASLLVIYFIFMVYALIADAFSKTKNKKDESSNGKKA